MLTMADKGRRGGKANTKKKYANQKMHESGSACFVV